MPFKLAIKTGPSHFTLPDTEVEFNESVTTIGRGEANDIRLPDPKRLVSSRHAQIRQQLNQYVLVDVESTNGTTLNGQPLEANKEYPLNQHDEIGIGAYVLEFLHLIPEPTRIDGDFDGDETVCLAPVISHFEKVVQRLRVLYRDLLPRDPHERTTILLETLRDSIKGLDPGETDRLLAYVEATFPDSEFQQERLLNEPQGKGAESPRSSPSIPGSGRIASHYLPSHFDSLSPESVAQLSERIERVLEVFFEYLVDAIHGRRQFEEELDVPVTRILNRQRSPIKWANSSQEVGAILFDVQGSTEKSDDAVQQLEGALADLALHPIGLMAGVRECVLAVLKQLDPAVLEDEAKAASSRLGRLAVGPLLKKLAWDRFTKKHQILLEEEVKTFQNLLGPEFAKGYLRVYQQTKSP